MDSEPPVSVTVAFALPERQWVLAVKLGPGSTVADAIARSGIRELAGDRLPAELRTGVFGRLCTPDTLLRDGDRVEIYRPLECDPKEVRRRRAETGKG